MKNPVTRTLRVLKYGTNPIKFPDISEDRITCEVTGQMDTGEKVWTETKTGDQYFCTRFFGQYFFYRE